MSYLVLARKWRPSTFDEVVGQGHVTRTLKNAIELNRVAHALLFTGSRGVGKTSCARILAKALNCETGPTPNPCGQCAACVEINSGASVDVFEIDGASNNSVEQIREIRESVKFLPSKGKRKMYIIDEVHMLSTSAFNALLKTLEEPPEHVLFVFATTEPHKIPDTILSRCQRYDFKRIAEREIVAALTRIGEAEGLEVEPEAYHHIAREAQGGMRDSLSLLDQVIAFCGTTIDEKQTREVLGIADRGVLFALTQALFAGDANTALEVVDQLFRFGLDLKKFAGELVQHLRDLMVVKVCGDPSRLVDVPSSELAKMAALVGSVHPAQIHRLFGAMLEGADSVNRSPYPKLVLEMTLMRLCHQGSTLPLNEVLDGLSRLEARLAAGGAVAERAAPSTPSIVVESVTPPANVVPSAVAQEAAAPAEAPPPTASVSEPAPAPSTLTAPTETPAIESPSTDTPATDDELAPWEEAPEPESARASLAAEAPPIDAAPPSPAVSEPPPPANPEPMKSAPPAEAEAPKEDKTPPKKEPPKATEKAGGERTFKRRPSGAATDDFSAPPPTPKAPNKLPKLVVKPRAPGSIVPASAGGETEDDADSEGAPEARETKANVQPMAPDVIEGTPETESAAEPPSEQVHDEPAMPLTAIDFDEDMSQTERFARLVGEIRQRDPFLASEIEQTVFLQVFDPSRLSMAISRQDYEGLSRGLPKLKAVIELLCPSAPEVELVACPFDDERLSGETLYVRRRRMEKEARARRRESARTDPTILMAAERLEANIIDIKPQ